MNEMVKFFDMIPFSALGLTLPISRTDLQRYRFNCFSSPNNTASHAVMRCHIREKARLCEAVIHFHQPAYRLTGGKEVEPFTPYPYPAKLHISQGRALFLSSTATRPSREKYKIVNISWAVSVSHGLVSQRRRWMMVSG